MQYTISAATLLALASAVNAQTAGFDAMKNPAKDEAVPACADYTINWEYVSTYAGTVTLQLLNGATPTTLQLGPVLAAGVDNSLGAYTWSVDCALGTDATYGIKITYDNDASGVTFQYSNPFSITPVADDATEDDDTAAAATTAAATDAPATTEAADPAAAADEDVDDSGVFSSTVYSTAYLTVTSCAASVTDCPARSTVVSSILVPTDAAAASSVPAISSAPVVPSTFTTAAAVITTPVAPVYPAGNTTTTAAGTAGLSTKTGGVPATTAPITTAGAGRVAMGGAAALVGLLAAVFAQ